MSPAARFPTTLRKPPLDLEGKHLKRPFKANYSSVTVAVVVLCGIVVVVMVIALHVVMVTAIMPCVVPWSWSLCCMVLWS
jgi:hypothetical protein